MADRANIEPIYPSAAESQEFLDKFNKLKEEDPGTARLLAYLHSQGMHYEAGVREFFLMQCLLMGKQDMSRSIAKLEELKLAKLVFAN